GRLLGYLLGATRFRSMVEGTVAGPAIQFQLELRNPETTRSVIFAGTFDRTSMNLTASGDVAAQPVVAQRLRCELTELQLAAADLSGGAEPGHIRELAVVVDDEGAFVSGGFVGSDDCVFWACDGGLTSYGENADVLTIGLETDGGCSAGSVLTATWDPGSGLYFGSSTFHDCGGTTSGAALAGRAMATTSTAARELLAGRTAIAESMEAGAPLPVPLPGLAPGFLQFGRDEPALRAELESELLGYSDIRVDLGRARGLATETQPRTYLDLVQPLGWAIDERRSGVPVGGGPGRITFRDTGVRPLIDDLARVGPVGGHWRITGNQHPALDLPFDYTVAPGVSRILAPTADAEPVYVSLGPYGAHFGPLTGDPSGEAKANFIGFLVAGDAEMEELEGDFDGVREPGELWGYPIGGDLTGNRVRNRRPVYRLPVDAILESLSYEGGPNAVYFDTEPQWRLEMKIFDEMGLTLGHVGRIAGELRDQVLAATGIDPWTFAGPVGTDLLAGSGPLPIAAGAELALPQILADPVPGHPGYWGSSGFLEYPWTQIEFQLPYHLEDGLGGDFCIYRFLPPARRAELQATMDLDMLDPQSQRYRDSPFFERWHWTAQGGLCQAESPLPRDFSSLDTRFGGWYERPEAGTSVDELFSFIPIDRAHAAYDPANYESPDVDHLAIRFLWPGPYDWILPDTTVTTVSEAIGEVLAWDGAALLVKWRNLNATNPAVYQRAAYLLDAAGLKVRWGNLASSAGGATLPALLPGDPCDDSATLCYDHALGAWPPSP
ncbi:MAG: hypothetical protein AB7P46_12135, partial [Thermoanaerobaculia bacterium]